MPNECLHDMPDQTRKRDYGKPRLFLVPPELDRAVGAVMTFGARKYGENTWRDVEAWRYRDALARHFTAYKQNPQGLDVESGLPHLWHLATNAAFLCAMEAVEIEEEGEEYGQVCVRELGETR